MPFSLYLPDFHPCKDEDIGASATIVDVLCHSLGLRDAQGLYLGIDGSMLLRDEGQMIRIINNMWVQPGDFRRIWSYNALTNEMATMLIEKLSGASYRDFMEARIFYPLGMSRTRVQCDGTCHEDSANENVAVPYGVTANGIPRPTSKSPCGHQTHYASSCGIQSSVADMLIWSEAIIKSYHCAVGLDSILGETRILKEAPRTLAPICPLSSSGDGQASYAMGWFHMEGSSINEAIPREIITKHRCLRRRKLQ